MLAHSLPLSDDWPPSLLPSHCVCGHDFTVEHALSFSSGSFPSIRHNEIRDLTGKVLTETCHNVGTEPPLQPVNDEHFSYKTANSEDGARLDIAADNFWGNDRQRAFFDIGVFNPHAPLIVIRPQCSVGCVTSPA